MVVVCKRQEWCVSGSDTWTALLGRNNVFLMKHSEQYIKLVLWLDSHRGPKRAHR